MTRRPVKVLPPEVACKIAAGEVIDRPNAIVRELLDNAVDSGATKISVEIAGGGIDKIRVVDNGSGLTKEDMEVCAKPHATSKITSEVDLLNLSTLGFRGEALSSISSVSRLTITSGSWKLQSRLAKDNIIEPCQEVEGTIVQSENLFENFPARRVFLKRPASETKMCHSTFIEKTLPRPDIAFRFYVDNELRNDLPSGVSLTSRFVHAMNFKEAESLFYEIKGEAIDKSWSYTLILGDPIISRNDKKDIFIFVNGRKIVEYSLVQAIEYGATGYFPNGTHPVAVAFIKINSDLVDFNIHPAKKEARFKDISALHHSISSSVRNFFHNLTLKTMKDDNDTQYEFQDIEKPYSNDSKNTNSEIDFNTQKTSVLDSSTDERGAFFSNSTGYEKRAEYDYKSPSTDYKIHSKLHPISNSKFDSISELADSASSYNGINTEKPISDATGKSTNEAVGSSTQNKTEGKIKYFGTTLGCFLLAEKNNILYLIDQHAAHERYIYDNILSEKNKCQKLLIPYEIEPQSQQDDDYLASIQDKMKEVGFTLKKCENGKWEVESVHERWKGSQRDFENTIFEKRYSPEEIISKIAAMTACKAAVKDGYILDEDTASDLAQKALNLKDPHCPHGRPVYTMLSREKLFMLVKRT